MSPTNPRGSVPAWGRSASSGGDGPFLRWSVEPASADWIEPERQATPKPMLSLWLKWVELSAVYVPHQPLEAA